MIDDFQIYIHKCRQEQGLTIEKAAEYMEVATRTIGSYESGAINPKDEVAYKLAEVYRNPLIAYKWLYRTNCGKLILPKLEEISLSQLILEIQEALQNLINLQHRLISIGKDNVVDEMERQDFNNICNQGLRPLIKNGLGLILLDIKKDHLRPIKSEVARGKNPK